MKSTAKSAALLRDVADKLKLRLKGAGLNTVRAANDANGWPMLIMSNNANEAEAQPVVIARISAIDAVSKDIFGNQTFAYAPHVLEIGYELNVAGKPIPAQSDLLKISFELIKTGVKVQLKEIANANAVSEASLNAAAVAVEIDELNWPAKGV